MDEESYDIGYFEGVRNAYRILLEVHASKELGEVIGLVSAEMRDAMRIMEYHQAENDGEWD